MNREEALDAAKKNCWFFLDYAKEFRGDKEVMIEAVKNDHSIITKAHKKLRKDKDFMMAAVQSSGWNIQYASDELKKDRELTLAALKQNPWAIREIDPSFYSDKEIVMLSVSQDGDMLQFASDELKNDREVVMAAVQSNGWNIQYASKELKKDRELTLAAVAKNPWAIKEVDPTFYSDKELMMISVFNVGETLVYASHELKNDKEVVMKALQYRNGDYQDAYKYASEELKCDKEIIRRHLSNGGTFHLIPMKVLGEVIKDKDIAEASLIHDENNYTRFDSSLYQDKELIKRVAERNPAVLSKITHFNDDKEVIMAGVNFRGIAFYYASERLRNDPEVVLAAVKGSYSAGAYVGDTLYEQLKSVIPHEIEHKEDIVHNAIPYLEDLVKAQKFSQKLDSELPEKTSKADRLVASINEDAKAPVKHTRSTRQKI